MLAYILQDPNVFLSCIRQALHLTSRKIPGNDCLKVLQFELISLDITNKIIVRYSSILYKDIFWFGLVFYLKYFPW